MNKILVALVAVVALALGLYFFEGTEVHRCPIHGEEMTEGTCDPTRASFTMMASPTWFDTELIDAYPNCGVSLKSRSCWVCPKCKSGFINEAQARMKKDLPPDMMSCFTRTGPPEKMQPADVTKQYVEDRIHLYFGSSAFMQKH
ncbi:MAG: hypothetical protein RBU27_05465 [Bacteroidota bacterium]|jgi:hypothetical protein|nr:hypothetical protein [Bacteroidota bacterium]